MSFFKRNKTTDLPAIKALASVEYKPGDTLVIECERRVPRDVFTRLRTQLQERTGCNVLLLEAGLELKTVLRKEAIDGERA